MIRTLITQEQADKFETCGRCIYFDIDGMCLKHEIQRFDDDIARYCFKSPQSPLT